MPWSTAGLNARAAAAAALVTAVSVHSGDPGAAGANNEWSGGGYTRQAPSYGAPAGGVADLDAPLAFTGPALTNASHFGLWAGATFLGGFARSGGDAASNAAGEYSLTSAAITAT